MCRWRQYIELCASGDGISQVMCKWRQSVLSCYVQVETVYIKLLCASGDGVSQVMCKWRECILSCYVQVLCSSRRVYQLTLVPYPYIRYNEENLRNKSTIKHLATAVCPSA